MEIRDDEIGGGGGGGRERGGEGRSVLSVSTASPHDCRVMSSPRCGGGGRSSSGRSSTPLNEPRHMAAESEEREESKSEEEGGDGSHEDLETLSLDEEENDIGEDGLGTEERRRSEDVSASSLVLLLMF